MSITYEEIAQRAFEIWEREGKPHGKDQDHWLQAEIELRNEAGKKQVKSGKAEPSTSAPAVPVVNVPTPSKTSPAKAGRARA